MYIVEGNIGAGKSTFLAKLEKHVSSLSVIQEPVETWSKNCSGASLLENFYQDQKRWTYTLETLTMIYRSQEHIRVQNLPIKYKIMERSIYSGHYCFALNGRDHGNFNNIEWNLYNQWVEFLFTQKCRPPRGFIYLQATPEVCYERIQKRSRSGEESVSLNYLKQIDDKHETFLVKKQGLFNNLEKTPVLILNANHNFEKNPAIFYDYIKRIEFFLKKKPDPTNINVSFL